MALTKIPGSLIDSGDNLTITDLTVTGNLSVTGTSTSLETATLQVEDKNIVLNYGSGDTSASADGAGITIQDAIDSSNDATLLWGASNDRFKLSHGLEVLTGNVGIGTASPSGLLSLEKGTRTLDVKLETSPASGDVGVQFRAGASDYLGLAGGGGSAVGVVIDSNNNVGIGTTSPSNGKLHVVGADYNEGIIVERTDTSSKWGLAGLDSGSFQIFDDNQGDATRLAIDSSGNVGIGRTSPGAKLDVNGSMYVDNIELQDSSGLGIGAVSGAGVSIGHTASVNEGIFWHSANDQYGIYRTSGAWSGSNYQQLKAYWDTGIILDGGVNYGLSGVSFQTNGTERVMIDQNAISLTHTGNTGESNQQPDVAKTTRAGIHFKVPSSGSSAGITWEAGSAGDTQAGYVVHNNNSDGTHHGWFSTNTYSGGPYCRMKLSNYGNLILGSSIDVGSVSASQFNTVHVHYGDIFCNATSSAHSLSDLLPGYSRGTYGCLKANGAYIYFSVNGSYVSYINSSGTYATSDERLKENITTLTGSLDKIKQLRGVNFTWIDTEHKGSETHIGLLAQEVEPHFPEVVGDGGLPHPDDENEEPYKNVNYAALVPALVEAIKELEARVAELEG